jgi:poly-beta-1,6-N-acetyl-D-glucosamine biosynthesis protein PgaD
MTTMNSESLIIDARQQLPWYKRLFSDTSTAVMWGGWILLWRPMLAITGLMSINHPHFIQNLLNFISLEHYFTALLACAAALLLWSALPSYRVKNPETMQLQDYAEYFELNTSVIQQGRDSQICVVHHDEHGKIVNINPEK